jgi:hypothetical protein
MLRSGAFRADRDRVRQHCAQCLAEVFTSGYETPKGETLCGPCYSALWGPRTNGNKVASAARPRVRFLEPVDTDRRGLLRR